MRRIFAGLVMAAMLLAAGCNSQLSREALAFGQSLVADGAMKPAELHTGQIGVGLSREFRNGKAAMTLGPVYDGYLNASSNRLVTEPVVLPTPVHAGGKPLAQMVSTCYSIPTASQRRRLPRPFCLKRSG